MVDVHSCEGAIDSVSFKFTHNSLDFSRHPRCCRTNKLWSFSNNYEQFSSFYTVIELLAHGTKMKSVHKCILLIVVVFFLKKKKTNRIWYQYMDRLLDSFTGARLIEDQTAWTAESVNTAHPPPNLFTAACSKR